MWSLSCVISDLGYIQHARSVTTPIQGGTRQRPAWLCACSNTATQLPIDEDVYYAALAAAVDSNCTAYQLNTHLCGLWNVFDRCHSNADQYICPTVAGQGHSEICSRLGTRHLAV